jgi:DNA invertase Pin-like site-specific DNA recombinase
MRYGYARVSKKTQSLDRQLDILKSYGVDKIVAESVSGIGKQIELEKLILNMQKGDILIVTRLSRLGRSSQSVFKRLSTLQGSGIDIIVISGGKVDTTTIQGKLFWSIITLFDELERDYISERTKEGLESARRKGRLCGRPPINPHYI